MNQYRKKPVVIEAIQYLGPGHPGHDVIAIEQFGAKVEPTGEWSRNDNWDLVIVTLEGQYIASIGDWIIKGVKGEFYPCKPDIFEATYEEVLPLLSPNPNPGTDRWIGGKQ